MSTYFSGPITGVIRNTVAEVEMLYTRREVEQAKKAQEVLRRLGYPSPGALTELLQHGGMLNAPITSQDVQRALKIYEPSVESILDL
jgi:hypothetical protein